MKRGTLVLPGLLLLLLLLAACSKRPVTTAVSAPTPSPTASSPSLTSRPSPAQLETSATPTNPSVRGGSMTAPTGGTRVTPATPRTPGRIPPREFAPAPDLVDIHFAFDKYDIRPEAARILDANAVWLRANPASLVLIEGHCDERGTSEYNLALGERRASAARNYLVALGVQATRISVVSYGKERPICTERNEACWAKNRRAHFLVKAQ